MSKLRQKINNGGLQKKIFRLCILLVVTAGIGFAILGTVELRLLQKKAVESSRKQAEDVSELSESSMMKMTDENMMKLARSAALSAYFEIWVMQHDAVTLANQVQDVIEHPEKYTESEVYPPMAENADKLALQFMKPEGYEPSEEDMVLMRKLATLSPMMEEMIRDNNYYTLDLLVSFPNGLMLDMDTMSQVKVDEKGNPVSFDPRERPWYKGALETKDYYLAPPSYSDLLDCPDLAFGVPIFIDGEVAAIVESSMKMERVTQALSTAYYGETGFVVVIARDGTLIYSPKDSGELKMDNTYQTTIEDIGNQELIDLVDRTFADEEGFDDITIDGEGYYVAFGNGITNDWALFTFVSRHELEEPTQKLLDTMDATTADMLDSYEKNFKRSFLIIIIVISLLVINAVLTALMFSGRLTGPINHMTNQVRSISGDSFNFELEDIYNTGDEIEVLAGTFQELSERTRKYISEITAITAEKERIGAELNVATRIQASMLPKNFPIFPDRKEFDLYATMTPAKEVGGDLYDMFLIDDDHLCMVVGDVSGKGVPAALFMVISKTMLKNRAQNGGKPSEILYDVNNSLCEGNDEMMFVTVWIGILTISTGELIQGNAGHEYPVIQRKGEEYKLIENQNGLVLGALKNMEFEDITFKLDPGDALFMYTDGLPEATNAEDKRLENDGMMAAINKYRDAGTHELLAGIKEEVDAFVKEAPQFDDLTMLIIRYHGPQEDAIIKEKVLP